MAGSILGTRVLRSEDPRFLRGDGRYMANIAPANAVHVTYVRSHLGVRHIDMPLTPKNVWRAIESADR